MVWLSRRIRILRDSSENAEIALNMRSCIKPLPTYVWCDVLQRLSLENTTQRTLTLVSKQIVFITAASLSLSFQLVCT